MKILLIFTLVYSCSIFAKEARKVEKKDLSCISKYCIKNDNNCKRFKFSCLRNCYPKNTDDSGCCEKILKSNYCSSAEAKGIKLFFSIRGSALQRCVDAIITELGQTSDNHISKAAIKEYANGVCRTSTNTPPWQYRDHIYNFCKGPPSLKCFKEAYNYDQGKGNWLDWILKHPNGNPYAFFAYPSNVQKSLRWTPKSYKHYLKDKK